MTLQKELIEYIKTIYSGEIIENDRTILNGKELDIVIPELSIAFEVNGIVWHSFGYNWPKNINSIERNKNKLENKRIKAHKKGYSLFNISDQQWITKKEIVKSLIAKKIGKGHLRISARKCEMTYINAKCAYAFLYENYINSFEENKKDKHIGLYYENNLVGVITFNSSEKLVKYFCSKIYYSIIGGLRRLVKMIFKIEKIKSLEMRINKNINSFHSIKKLGYKIKYETKNDIFYFDKKLKKLYHKTYFNYKNFNSEQDELNYLLNKGLRRYYSCGYWFLTIQS